MLKSTITNITRQRNSYSDFPFPDGLSYLSLITRADIFADVPNYPTGEQVCQYMDDYADNFHLKQHIRLGFDVKRIERTADGKKWNLHCVDKSSTVTFEQFDKVVVANGTFNRPFLPKIEGAAEFGGRMLHSQAYKEWVILDVLVPPAEFF